MTKDEFRQAARPLLADRPPVPVVLEFVAGPKFVVDAPGQLALGPTGFTVHHVARTPVSFLYDDVTRAVPLTDLPAETGAMSYRDFYAAVRPLFWAEPFRPYALDLRDGRTLTVRGPGRLTLAGRFGTLLSDDPPGVVRFTVDQVAQVRAAEAAKAG